MTTKPVLVIGGTGKTGRRVVRLLRERGVPARPASCSGEVRFDWLDESTWGPALDGASGVYIVQNDGDPRTRALVRTAVASGVQRLALLSARGVDTPGYYGEDPATSEAFLEGRRPSVSRASTGPCCGRDGSRRTSTRVLQRRSACRRVAAAGR